MSFFGVFFNRTGVWVGGGGCRGGCNPPFQKYLDSAFTINENQDVQWNMFDNIVNCEVRDYSSSFAYGTLQILILPNWRARVKSIIVPDDITGTCFEKKRVLYTITKVVCGDLWFFGAPLGLYSIVALYHPLPAILVYVYMRTPDRGLRYWPYSWNTVNFSLWSVVCCFTSRWRIWRHHYIYRRRADIVRLMIDIYDLWAGRDLYRATGPRFRESHSSRTN